MTDTPALWALDRISQKNGFRDFAHLTEFGSASLTNMACDFARYIEAHETPHVDPVLQVAIDVVRAYERAEWSGCPLTSPKAINRPDIAAAAAPIRAYLKTLEDAK